MKSSSELFPVSLLRADVLSNLTDDVYLLKHGRDDSDQSVQVALSRVGLYGQDKSGRQPVVLVHGSFTNRGFWLSANGVGFARYLVEEGFDVWMVEMRGHGLSPRNHNYRHNSVEHYIRSDFPAVNDFIVEQTGIKPVWLGHSLGGVSISTALAAGSLSDLDVAGAVLLGTQVIRKRWGLRIPFATTIGKILFSVRHEMDGRKMKIGPENEPAGIAKEYLRWLGMLGSWRLKSNKTPLLNKWKGLDLPVLSVAGKVDKTDPARYCRRFWEMCGSRDKDFRLLAKDNGFSKDYGHIDMIVSKSAATEVWPEVSDWLKKIPLNTL